MPADPGRVNEARILIMRMRSKIDGVRALVDDIKQHRWRRINKQLRSEAQQLLDEAISLYYQADTLLASPEIQLQHPYLHVEQRGWDIDVRGMAGTETDN